jgi:hypothetical protein
MKSTLDVGFRMGAYVSSTPQEFCQLQAADIFAYELSKEFENRIKRPNDKMRWALREIMSMNRSQLPRVLLVDRLELLRTIKEARFPDQTGVEEIHNYDMLSAQSKMIKVWKERLEEQNA